MIIDPDGQDWFYYQDKKDKEPQWHWQKGSTAKYIDVDGNEQQISNGYEYLMKYTITKDDNGYAQGYLELYYQDKRVSLNDDGAETSYAFSGDHSHPHLKEGNWFMDLSVRPKVELNGNMLKHINKGMQFWGNRDILNINGQWRAINEWGGGRIKLNYGSNAYDHLDYYLHDRNKSLDFTFGCLATRDFNYIASYFIRFNVKIVPLWVKK